jgi:hypothetical protein
MVQKLQGGATYSSLLLTKSQNKYKNRRTPTEWELITQADNTIVRWEPYKKYVACDLCDVLHMMEEDTL